jgi:hypothetical protein
MYLGEDSALTTNKSPSGVGSKALPLNRLLPLSGQVLR